MGQGERRDLPPRTAGLIRWLAAGTAAYNLWAVFGYPEVLLHRGLNFGLFFSLIFLLYTTPGGRSTRRIPWYDWLLAGASACVSLYLWANLDRLLTRLAFVASVRPADLFCGILAVALLLEGTRRVIGPWLSALSAAALAYALWGQHLPGLFSHAGFPLGNVFEELFMTTDGIWGGALGIATTYIAVFVLFSSFLRHSGGGDFLYDFASALAGRSRGGLAKIGVITSGLFGMISGSPVANVTSTGSLTIPMMKKSGYPPDFSAAIECCASTGGTIMPPIMGSVAFIMAEVTGLPYIRIAAAAVLPALLYYAALFFAADFRAGKLGMKGLPPEEIPPLGKILWRGLVFFFPLAYLIWRLMAGFSPSRVGFEAILLTLAVSWFRKETRMGPRKIIQALTEGTVQNILIVATMATSGILLGVINLTGLGTKISALLLTEIGCSLPGTLFLTMGMALFLGLPMGITPAYLLTAVIAGPFLVGQGLTPMTAHFFILFYATMAPMTPPVATTAFAAAGLAGAPPMRVGFLAMRIASAAYLMPFIFVYRPALLLQGSPLAILSAALAGLLALMLFAAGFEGWYGRNLRGIRRMASIIAGIFALSGNPWLLAIAVLLAVVALGPVAVFPEVSA